MHWHLDVLSVYEIVSIVLLVSLHFTRNVRQQIHRYGMLLWQPELAL